MAINFPKTISLSISRHKPSQYLKTTKLILFLPFHKRETYILDFKLNPIPQSYTKIKTYEASRITHAAHVLEKEFFNLPDHSILENIRLSLDKKRGAYMVRLNNAKEKGNFFSIFSFWGARWVQRK